MPTPATDQPHHTSGDRPSLQSEAQRLAEAARERAADAFEEIKLASNQVVDKVRELIEEGNVRRISLRKGEKTIFEIPLTVGAGAAAAALLYNPLIAGVGAVAALVSDITLVVERDEDAERTPGAAEGAAKNAGSQDAGSASSGSSSGSGDTASGSASSGSKSSDSAAQASDSAEAGSKTVGKPPSDDAA